MITNERDQKICDKYGATDETGHVHCSECPLVKDSYYLMCKANSHYDRHTGEWEPDYGEETEE